MTGLVLAILAAAAAALPQPADQCRTRACNERVAAKACSNSRPRACVERAIITYRLGGEQAAWMRRVPHCESTWNPLAYFRRQVAETAIERRWAESQGRSAGLYAFKPSTWRGLRYRAHSLWLAKWSSLGAALMVRSDRRDEWTCR